jgi:hypothetical protein
MTPKQHVLVLVAYIIGMGTMKHPGWPWTPCFLRNAVRQASTLGVYDEVMVITATMTLDLESRGGSVVL